MDSGAWQAKVPGVTQESDTTEATFVVVQSLSCVRLFVTPWTVARHAPLSMGFSRQEYWRRLLSSPPGDLPDPGIEPMSHVACIGR